MCILVEEPTKEFTLPASATKTSISDLTPDVDYEVTISAYVGSEESLPISGQITRESPCPRVCVQISTRRQKATVNRVCVQLHVPAMTGRITKGSS